MKIKIYLLLVMLFLLGCNKEPKIIKRNKLKPEKFGSQTYLTEIQLKENNKNPKQWKKEAEQYLKMKEGDTMTVYINESQKQIKQDNIDEETYEPFVDVDKIREMENLQQQRRKIIKERYYIENPNHTWRRVSKKEYYGY